MLQPFENPTIISTQRLTVKRIRTEEGLTKEINMLREIRQGDSLPKIESSVNQNEHWLYSGNRFLSFLCNGGSR